MGLLTARTNAAAANGKWVSKPAIFTIVAEILRRQREDQNKMDNSHDAATVETEMEKTTKKGVK